VREHLHGLVHEVVGEVEEHVSWFM
jgi:hypothetical protein